jgi:O-antigen/teichoic acid export membrane protein
MLRNIGSNWGLTVATIAATYVMTPFVIHTLGQEGYGTWTLITAMTGYMSLMSLGVPMACVRYLAQDVAKRDRAKANVTIGSCAGLYLLMSAAALIVGAVLTVLFITVYDLPSPWRGQASIAFGLMVVQVAAGFVGFLPEGILFAHHDFVARNIVRIVGVILRLVLTIGLLHLRASLVVLALIQIAGLVFDFSMSLLIVRRRYPDLRVTLADFDWAMVRKIFSFSLFVLLLAAGARLSFETDAMVIGAILGVAAIPFYAVANSLVVYLMDFVIAIAAVVAPMATKLDIEGRRGELREIFLKWSKVALSLSLMAGVFLVVLGPRFLGWWIGSEYEYPSGAVLQILMISSLAFLPVRGVALPVLMGLGKPKVPTIAFIGAGVLNLVLSIALAHPLGLAGVALGTAIPNVLFAAVVLRVACRELDLSLGTYVRYVIPRATLGSVPAVALLMWFKFGLEVRDLRGLIVAGAAMVLLFAVTSVIFVFRDDPYVDFLPHLVRLRAWGRV